MFRIRLTLRHLPDGRLSLTVPLSWRLLLAGIAMILLASLAAVARAEHRGLFAAVNVFPLLVTAICFLGACYREEWIFDRAAGLVTSRYGLIFLYRIRGLPMTDVSKVVLSRLFGAQAPAGGQAPGAHAGKTGTGPDGRGIWKRSPLLLTIERREERPLTLETAPASHAERLRQIGGAVAEYCGVPFTYLGS